MEYQFIDPETRIEIGATTSEFYVDEDGNGKFAIKYVENFRLAKLPDWVTPKKN